MSYVEFGGRWSEARRVLSAVLRVELLWLLSKRTGVAWWLNFAIRIGKKSEGGKLKFKKMPKIKGKSEANWLRIGKKNLMYLVDITDWQKIREANPSAAVPVVCDAWTTWWHHSLLPWFSFAQGRGKGQRHCETGAFHIIPFLLEDFGCFLRRVQSSTAGQPISQLVQADAETSN